MIARVFDESRHGPLQVMMQLDSEGLAAQQAAEAARREAGKLGMKVLQQQMQVGGWNVHTSANLGACVPTPNDRHQRWWHISWWHPASSLQADIPSPSARSITTSYQSW